MNKTIVQTVKIPCRKYYFDHNDKFEKNYYLWTKPLWGEGMPFSISKLCIRRIRRLQSFKKGLKSSLLLQANRF